VPDRVGIVFAGTLNGGSRFERAETVAVDAQQATAFTHIVYTPDSRNEARVVGWVQRINEPLESRLAFAQPAAAEERVGAHAQLTFEHRTAADRLWSAFAGYSVRQRAVNWRQRRRSSSIGSTTVRRGAALSGQQHRHALVRGRPHERVGCARVGSAAERANDRRRSVRHRHRMRRRSADSSARRSTVCRPHLGVFGYDGPSQWNETTLAAYAAQRFQVHPCVLLDLGLRYEHLSGSAEARAASRGTICCRAPGVRWRLTNAGHIAVVAGYSRTAHRLPLTDLTWSDPAAPLAAVSLEQRAPDRARAVRLRAQRARRALRSGRGATANFSTIDPDLKRPHLD
jgi:hypothetical protein